MCSILISHAFVYATLKKDFSIGRAALQFFSCTLLLKCWPFRLADTAVDALAHWSLCFVLVGMVDTFALVLLFNGRCAGLECRQIYWIRLHQLLGDGDNVSK